MEIDKEIEEELRLWLGQLAESARILEITVKGPTDE